VRLDPKFALGWSIAIVRDAAGLHNFYSSTERPPSAMRRVTQPKRLLDFSPSWRGSTAKAFIITSFKGLRTALRYFEQEPTVTNDSRIPEALAFVERA